MSEPLQKILYVEDEPDIRDIAQLVLENVGGFDVLAVDGGQKALQQINDFAPDLVLLDAMMPEMDGPTTFKEIRKLPNFKEIPIAFLTAKLMDDDIKGYLALGAIGVIAKPFDPMTLSEQVRDLWSKATAIT
ncbi:Response regulator receiver domain protein (CheY-like) [Candidatus Terasakiella magnetica]|uniref:Response regulator receiver domain protein (CheY-like) n=1 Tax=Candidatus Terasakiella magnetica TaxID=1867952 RepID=A0A1C3RC57_9PROT|nr:response regulator [Candidatus Terasakiella magnetica]SCA54863.1 Response regulator receiver domain protein (CheY-like) [Candidatus Terasakiella magnetica]